MTSIINQGSSIFVFSKKRNDLDALVKDILLLEKKCFPKSWLYDDAKKYYKKQLENPDNISIFVEVNGKKIGYLLAKPLKDTFDELKKKDKKIKNDKNIFYIDTVQILPKYQGLGFYKKIIFKLIDISKKRKIKKICLHARILNNTSGKTKEIFNKKYAKIIEYRNIKKWFYGGNEPYEFICFKL